jgi:hypothetical protein
MNCPPAIAEVILDIIQTGILRIRASAWSGDVAQAADEADHIHNLPTLLQCYSPELLKYYWDMERASILERKLDIVELEKLWQRLRPYVESPNEAALPPLAK